MRYYRYSARCRRCHKPIWDRESLRTGYGPECRKKFRYGYGNLAPVIVSRFIQRAEIATAPTQPHIALTLEVIRQTYNHREYIYDIWKDLSSSRSASEKLGRFQQRTTKEIRDEFTGYLINGGVRTVSAQLSQIGFFKRPLAERGPSLDDNTAESFRKFFESSLTNLVGK